MELNTAAHVFSVLGHPARLALFRLLMRHAPQGARPTEMAAALDLKPNTLSHHLSDLESAGLIHAQRQGRSLYYTINLPQVAGLMDFLTLDCCRGRPDLCPTLPLSAMEPDMTHRPYNVLFICSGNSARSIFAEAILNDAGKGRFIAYSAGTRPGTQLNAYALEVLNRAKLDTTHLRSIHLSEFETPDAPQMDFVFTVCDAAAAEECAPWPGQPLTAHWGVPDPVKAIGTDAEKGLAFARAFSDLHHRITAFCALPFEQLDRLALQKGIDRIGLDQA